MAIYDALPFKAARRDVIVELKSFWGFKSELQMNPMPFHLHRVSKKLQMSGGLINVCHANALEHDRCVVVMRRKMTCATSVETFSTAIEAVRILITARTAVLCFDPINFSRYPEPGLSARVVFNPLKGSGVRWLHFEVLSAIQV